MEEGTAGAVAYQVIRVKGVAASGGGSLPEKTDKRLRQEAV